MRCEARHDSQLGLSAEDRLRETRSESQNSEILGHENHLEWIRSSIGARPMIEVARLLSKSTRMTAEALAVAIDPDAHRYGRHWRTHCPFPSHSDRHPSFDITNAADGRVLFICRPGAPQAAVIDALISMGLWERSEARISRPINCGFTEPNILACRYQRPLCEHWRDFERENLVANLLDNLHTAISELQSVLDRKAALRLEEARPVSRDELRRQLEYSFEQAEELTWIRITTWQAWAYRRRIPIMRLGRRIRLRETDLQRRV